MMGLASKQMRRLCNKKLSLYIRTGSSENISCFKSAATNCVEILHFSVEQSNDVYRFT
jgi:hypothetical protein